MGEIAEMMLDGTLCEWCGVYIEGDAPGYPRLCRDCASEKRKDERGKGNGKNNQKKRRWRAKGSNR